MFKPFTFQIEFQPGIDDNDYKVRKQSGIVYAESFSDAVTRLMNYYGEDVTVALNNIVELEDSPILLNAKIIKKIMEDEYFDDYDD